MIKLLVEAPSGFQELIQIDASGSYFDPALVTWDERVNGPFPPALIPEVGGLVKSGAVLVVDAIKKAAYQTAKATQATGETNKQAKLAAAKARVLAYDDDTATALERKQYFKDLQHLVKYLLNL